MNPAGPRPVQLRYETGLTGEGYVRAEAWRDARLKRCPNHPHGGCSLARHGTYARKSPRGTKIARWYCPESHTTFSLLPECLAARFPGELDEVEAVVAHAEQAPSLAAAANELRRDAVELPGCQGRRETRPKGGAKHCHRSRGGEVVRGGRDSAWGGGSRKRREGVARPEFPADDDVVISPRGPFSGRGCD